MIVVAFYEDNYAGIFAIVTLICLGYSILLHIRGNKLYIPALFASFGFMAMSVSVYGFTGLPSAHLLLALQSLLVVSIALWYKSRIIIIVSAIYTILIMIIKLLFRKII